jgi:E3 ubiquitin-protein ligase makorin
MQIIQGYQGALAGKHCRHFDFGRGECPFGTSCFYRHEYDDGTLQDRTPEFRKAVNADGEHAVIQPINLSSFLDARAGWATFRPRGQRHIP